MYFATEHFKHYLQGEFILFTDHKPLTHLFKERGTINPKLARCMDILVYSVLSHCKSVSHEYRNVEFPELSLISESDSQTCVEPVREIASVATCHA